MFAFGAMFGSTVMARMSLFIGRLDFLLTDWQPIVPIWFWMAVLFALAVYVPLMLRNRRRKKRQAAEE